MRLYRVKIAGVSMFVVAANFLDAMAAGLSKMNPNGEPEGVYGEENVDSVEHVCEDDELVLPKAPEPPVPEPINFDIRGYVSRNGWHFSVDAEGAVVIRADEGSETTVMVRFVWETWHSAVWYMSQMRRAFIAKQPVEVLPAAQSQTGEI